MYFLHESAEFITVWLLIGLLTTVYHSYSATVFVGFTSSIQTILLGTTNVIAELFLMIHHEMVPERFTIQDEHIPK
jgi:hypothetical protein